MARVFISHSKDDKKGRIFFDKLFSSSQHQAYWYSWEGPTPPHAKTLLEALKASSALFVILSKKMEKKHTRSWVGYEVGLAAALQKNVWVFEPINSSVNVPVPYITGYIQYPEKLDSKNTFPYANIVESAGMEIPTDPDSSTLPQFVSNFCPYEDCKAPFYRYVYKMELECPVCKRRIVAIEYKGKK